MITEITNMVALANGRMLQQYQNSPGPVAYQSLLIEPLQEAERQAFLLMWAYSVANATGQLLSWIGKLHGEPRPLSGSAATDDNAYRVLIYARIAANTSHGTIPDLYNLLGLLQLQDDRIYEDAPAHVTINFVNNAPVLTCNCVSSIIKAAKLAVTVSITEHTETPFGYEGDANAWGYDIGELGENI
jgi:hypothetical protein